MSSGVAVDGRNVEGHGQRAWQTRWRTPGVSGAGCPPGGLCSEEESEGPGPTSGTVGEDDEQRYSENKHIATSRLAEQRVLQASARLGEPCRVPAFFPAQFRRCPFRQQVTCAGARACGRSLSLQAAPRGVLRRASARLRTCNPTLSPGVGAAGR